MSMQLGFSLSNKKHAGDAQTMPFRECSLAHMENLFKFHWNNVGEKNSIIAAGAFVEKLFIFSENKSKHISGSATYLHMFVCRAI